MSIKAGVATDPRVLRVMRRLVGMVIVLAAAIVGGFLLWDLLAHMNGDEQPSGWIQADADLVLGVQP